MKYNVENRDTNAQSWNTEIIQLGELKRSRGNLLRNETKKIKSIGRSQTLFEISRKVTSIRDSGRRIIDRIDL